MSLSRVTVSVTVQSLWFCLRVVTDRTWTSFLILGSGGAGRRLPRRDTHSGINNYLWSFSCSVHFSILRVDGVQNHYTDPDRPWYPEKREKKTQPVCVWLLSAPQRSVCRFTMHLCQLNQKNTHTHTKHNQTVSVWLLVCSSEVGVPFHYAHMPIKPDIRQR